MIENIQTVMTRITRLRERFRSLKTLPEKFSTSKSSAGDEAKKTEPKDFASILKNKSLEQKEKTLSLDDKITRYSDNFGVDPSLVNALIKAESDFDPKAVSDKGAMGLMQLMPGTARELGVNNPFDIDDNLKGGISYLSGLLTKYSGNMEKALAAYNSGPGNVDRYNGIPPFRETINYVRKIMDDYRKK